MSVPDHLLRHPTRAAVDSLASRLGLPNGPGMQDWEYQVADPRKLDTFVDTYPACTEDERFVLMEVILESLRACGPQFVAHSVWPRVRTFLEANVHTHISTLCYWACLDAESPKEMFALSPAVRGILAPHAARYDVTIPP